MFPGTPAKTLFSIKIIQLTPMSKYLHIHTVLKSFSPKIHFSVGPGDENTFSNW